MLKDRLIGTARIMELVENDSRTIDADLKSSDDGKTGTLTVLIQSYDDPVYL